MISNEAPTQLVVLAGGLMPNGDPTQETYERTMSSVYYADRFPSLQRVVFSGGRSYLDNTLEVEMAEADIMNDIALENGMNPELIKGIDRNSNSTFETFLNVRPYLLEQKTAVITNAYHIPRALYMAKLTLPSIEFIGYEAFGEYTGKAKAPLSERMLRLATVITMQGIKPGDVETMTECNHQIADFVRKPAVVSLLRHTVLRGHTSVNEVDPDLLHKKAA
jgi:uncharacterized SAM-binding protein YcdF (DUF218 family)